MSLNKFFDVNTGQDIKLNVGATTLKCNNIDLNTINGQPYPQGAVGQIITNPTLSTENGAVLGTEIQNDLITNELNSTNNSILITGIINLDNPVLVRPPPQNNSEIYINVELPFNISSYYSAFDLIGGSASGAIFDKTSGNFYEITGRIIRSNLGANYIKIQMYNANPTGIYFDNTNGRKLYVNYTALLPID